MVFELDRGDPLSTRLDDVLGAVGDLDEPLLADATDVPRAQPTVVELVGGRVSVVAARDPRPAHFDLAHCLTVPRQPLTGVVDDAHLDAAQHTTGLLAPVHLLRSTWFHATRRARKHGEWARL